MRSARRVRRRRRGRGDAPAAAAARSAAHGRARRQTACASSTATRSSREARPASSELDVPAPVSLEVAEASRREACPRLEPRVQRVLRLRCSRRRARAPRRPGRRTRAAARVADRAPRGASGDRLGGDRLPRRVRGRRGGPRRHRPRTHDRARGPRARMPASSASSSSWPLGEDGRKLFAGTALFSEDGELLALAQAGLDRPAQPSAASARASRPPSSSYAGKKSMTTRFSRPALVRISSSWPIFRTPHSRTTSIGAESESASASTTSRPMRSASR